MHADVRRLPHISISWYDEERGESLAYEFEEDFSQWSRVSDVLEQYVAQCGVRMADVRIVSSCTHRLTSFQLLAGPTREYPANLRWMHIGRPHATHVEIPAHPHHIVWHAEQRFSPTCRWTPGDGASGMVARGLSYLLARQAMLARACCRDVASGLAQLGVCLLYTSPSPRD